MANQGTISGSTNYSAGGSMIVLFVRANWRQTPDPANNRSTLTLEYQARTTRGVYFEAAAAWAVSIGGQTQTAPTGALKASQSGSWTTCWTKDYIVAHDSHGQLTTTLGITGHYQVGLWEDDARVPVSGVETITLDPIDQGGGDTPEAASITEITPASLLLGGSNALSIKINRPTGGTSYCRAVVTLGSLPSDPITMDGAAGSQTYTYTPPASWAALVGEDSKATGTVTLTTYTASDHATVCGTATATWTGHAICSIASAPSSVDLPAAGATTPLSVTVGRVGAARYAGITAKCGSQTLGPVYLDLTSATTATLQVPQSWGTEFPTATSKAGTVRVTTYTSASNGTETGHVEREITVSAPPTLGPAAGTQLLWLEGGSYSGIYGTDTVSTTRVRSGYIQLDAGVYTLSNSIYIDKAYATYDTSRDFISDSDWMGTGALSIVLSQSRIIRAVWRSPFEEEITPREVTDVQITKGGQCVTGWAIAHPQGDLSSPIDGWGQAVTAKTAVRVRMDLSKVVFATAAGSSFSRAWATVEGKTYNLTLASGTIYTALSDTLTAPGASQITVTVEDTRGYRLTASYSPTVYPYSAPTITGVELYRCDDQGQPDPLQGQYIRVKATASVSPVGGYNSLTALRVWYRPSGGSWSAAVSLTSGTAATIGGGSIDTTKSYGIWIQADDTGGSSTVYEDVVSSAAVLIHAVNGGMRLGLGKYFDASQGIGDGWVDCGMSLLMDGSTVRFRDPKDVPYFDLGADGIEITSNQSLNSLVAIGNYYCPTGAIAQSLSDKPASLGEGFTMRVYCSSGPVYWNWIAQEIVGYTGHYVWRRYVELYSTGASAGQYKSSGPWYKFAGTAD